VVPSDGRSAARRVTTASERLAAWHVRKGRRLRPPSLRERESSGLCPHVVTQLQKSAGDVGPKYAHASGLPKEDRRE
jgi:hypothetical protein